MIKIKEHVIRRYGTTYSRDCPPGSGYCHEHWDKQYLVRDYTLFGIRIWRTTLDQEDVPLFVQIQLSTVGSTDWESKFSGLIKKERAEARSR